MDNETAYHEAGHAFIASYAGGRVLSVTIAPDWDDGPARYGDTQVAWRRSEFKKRELADKLVLVALAGPVAELIYRGEPWHPAVIAEWADDWSQAHHEATPFVHDLLQRTRWLERLVKQLHELLSDDRHWDAIAGIADHLLAHETLEQECYDDIVANWLR